MMENSPYPGCALRPLIPADEPFLREMLYQAIYVPAGEIAPPAEIVNLPELARYVQAWGRPGDGGFVAWQSTGLAGAVWFRLFGPDNKGYGYINAATPELSIAVSPEARGQGLGTILLNAAIALARPNYPGLSLSVDARNPARRLYERLGFESLDPDQSTLIMQIKF